MRPGGCQQRLYHRKRYHLGVGDHRGDTHRGAPRNPTRMVLEQVIGTDIQCRGKGIQIGVHANLRFDFG